MRIPTSTYRIQFNPLFRFKEAKDILSYLKSLGISDLYASPIFKSRKGSEHGYDVVDPNQINPELGGEEEFESLITELKKHGLFWLQDIVPNHMAYDKENFMLMDIFEQRDKSPFFHYFDIDWIHFFESFQGRVLAPFLGAFYSETLEKKEIKIVFQENGLFVQYYDLIFPLFLTTYQDVLLLNTGLLEERLGQNSSLLVKFLGIVDILSQVSTSGKGQDYDQIKHAKRMLWSLYNENADIKGCVDANLSFLNGDAQDHDAIEALDRILSKQCYRLSFWKVASEELNYRRFFTINGLISLRVEKKDVFDFTHQLILRLIQEGKVHGLRIDHIDGLYNPIAYLNYLREKVPDTYIVIEKILALEEELPVSMPVQGTTGYDFMNFINRMFCAKENEERIRNIYYSFANVVESYEKLVCDKKRLIIGKHMAGDIDNLAHLMKKVAGHHRFGRDITLYGLKRALVEVVTFFSVYRTYITQNHCEGADRNYIEKAISQAAKSIPDLEHEIGFIKKFLFLELVESLTEEEKIEFWQFIMKFQQLTAPIMAKGFEDTVFYIYNKLISLNEVGGEPVSKGITPTEFFRFLTNRSKESPQSFNATATHDTKRGEDVRARINVLSELPDVWEAHLNEWAIMNEGKKAKMGSESMPDKNDEYAIYQTLLGSFPFFVDNFEDYQQRIKDCVIKAVREAKVHTAWIKPDAQYEEACLSFVDQLLDVSKENKFFESFRKLSQKISHYGMYNSLSQTLIKMIALGVPDFYQGTELWDLSLVDPDNRRPVDYGKRMAFLEDMKTKEAEDLGALLKELLLNKADGRIKMFLIYKALAARNENIDIFKYGQLIPLEVGGKFKESVVSYALKHEDKMMAVVAPRFLTHQITEKQNPLGYDIWKDTHICFPSDFPKNWTNVITNEYVSQASVMFLGDILKSFPVALLRS